MIYAMAMAVTRGGNLHARTYLSKWQNTTCVGAHRGVLLQSWASWIQRMWTPGDGMTVDDNLSVLFEAFVDAVAVRVAKKESERPMPPVKTEPLTGAEAVRER